MRFRYESSCPTSGALALDPPGTGDRGFEGSPLGVDDIVWGVTVDFWSLSGRYGSESEITLPLMTLVVQRLT